MPNSKYGVDCFFFINIYFVSCFSLLKSIFLQTKVNVLLKSLFILMKKQTNLKINSNLVISLDSNGINYNAIWFWFEWSKILWIQALSFHLCLCLMLWHLQNFFKIFTFLFTCWKRTTQLLRSTFHCYPLFWFHPNITIIYLSSFKTLRYIWFVLFLMHQCFFFCLIFYVLCFQLIRHFC